jgi:hypothetical protein
MHKVLLTVLLLISSAAYSQDTINKKIERADTSATKKGSDNAQRYSDSLKSAQTNSDPMQGINNLVRYQDEQNAKKKKQAFLYLGLGIFFLVVLIVGLRRRVKK